MNRRRGSLFIVFFLTVFSACGSGDRKAVREPLLPAETFNWGVISLTFQPPPAQWERQKHNQGGLRGVWFTNRGSAGERIYVSEYYRVGQRSLDNGRHGLLKLDDVVEETRFSTEGWPVPADSFAVRAMSPDTVAGVPAYRLDFTLNLPERSLAGREYYFLEKDHLFEAAFLGLPENLPLFERVVESIIFEPVEGP